MVAAPCFKIKLVIIKKIPELLKDTNNEECLLIAKRMIQLCGKFSYTVQAWCGIFAAVFNVINKSITHLNYFDL